MNLLGIGAALFALTAVTGCVTYAPVYPGHSELKVVNCGRLDQQQPEHPSPSRRDFDPEALSVEDAAKAFVLRSSNDDRLVIIQNQLVLRDATLFPQYHSFLGVQRLAGGTLVVRYSSFDLSISVVRMLAELQSKYPMAQIQRPWMVDARLTPISPFVPTATALLPCDAGPIGDIPLQFILTRGDFERLLDQFSGDDLVLSGTLSFYEAATGAYYHRSFDLRRDQIKVTGQSK